MAKRFFALLPLMLLACVPAWGQQIPNVQHVFVVMEQNTNFADVCGPNNVSMPFLCGLKAQGSFSANYYSPTHPSIGNYEDLAWGLVSTNDDTCVPTTCGFAFSGDNIVREVLAAGKSWKGYAESLPSECYFGGDNGQYAARHTPIPYLSDVQSNCSSRFVAFEDPNLGFAHDLANNSLPSYAFITPNLCDDANDCTLPASPVPDKWLQNNVLQPLLSSGHLNQMTGDTVVIVTFDESGTDNTHGGGAIYWFMMGVGVKQNYQSTGPAVSPNYYSHESTLRLTAELLGLNFSGLGGAATAPSMSEFFISGLTPNPPTAFTAQVVGTMPPNPPSGFSAMVAPTPPAISITAPVSGATVSGTIAVATSVTADTTSVQLSVDGNKAGAAVTSSPFNFFLDTTTLSNASHLLTAMASNAAAQTTTSAAIVVIANNPHLAITTTLLPSGQLQVGYSASLQAISGTPPYTWSILSGQLPAGLLLSSTTGIISGIPTAAGSFSVAFQVMDSAGGATSAAFSLNIATPLPAAPFGHVIIVAEENANYTDIIGNPTVPYLNSLANQFGLATQYYANIPGSISAYFMWTTGQILTTNNGLTPLTFPVSVDNVVRELVPVGLTWKQYAESIPSVGYIGGDAVGPDGGTFYTRHVPLPYMTDVQNSPVQKQNIVPFTQFATDLAAGNLPNYSFITPNGCDDSHDCSFNTLDNWLKANIDPLIKSAQFQKDGLLIISFDESANDTTHGGGRVVTVLISPFSKLGYQSTTFYQHESVLRLMLKGLGVGTLPGAAATAPDMWEFFTFTPPN
jgi:acid phosphatase